MSEKMQENPPDYSRERSYQIDPLDWIRQRIDRQDQERQTAIEVQRDSYEKAIQLQREHYEQRVTDLETRFLEKVAALNQEHSVLIEANKELFEQYNSQQSKALETANAEREKSAEVLRNETQRALDKADGEREKAASALRDEQQRAMAKADIERERSADVLRSQLMQQIDAGDKNLFIHIDNQKEQVAAAFAASEKAILKAETANEKRFEGINEFRGQLRDQQAEFLLREIFDRAQTEQRNSMESLAQRVAANAQNIAEITARTGGGQDTSKEERDKRGEQSRMVAVGVSIVAALIAATGIIISVVIAAGAFNF